MPLPSPRPKPNALCAIGVGTYAKESLSIYRSSQINATNVATAAKKATETNPRRIGAMPKMRAIVATQT
jgi:hypothetical protein